jgi:hypothetical protein
MIPWLTARTIRRAPRRLVLGNVLQQQDVAVGQTLGAGQRIGSDNVTGQLNVTAELLPQCFCDPGK